MYRCPWPESGGACRRHTSRPSEAREAEREMCGITGFVTAGFGGDSRAVVHRMKAPPAYTLVVSPGATLARYWTLPFAPDRSIGKVEWIERLRHQLEALVRRRLSRDVPIGVFVSGGIDSGAAAARGARPTGGTPLPTLAVGFAGPTRLLSG